MIPKPDFMNFTPSELKDSWNSQLGISTLDMIQQQQKTWKEYNFPNNTDIDQFLGIVEEVGELAHAILKLRQGIRLTEDHRAGERDAIGDIAIFLLGYCNDNNISLMEIIKETWSTVAPRDWPAHRRGHQ